MKDKKTYFVDIDETICISPKDRNYINAEPIPERIDKINSLYEDGHTIIYWTARGSGSGMDWYSVTFDQLRDWGAKHHELRLGKPIYDLFICDKAINSESFFDDN
jgi:histidinol phosphatase-like enzyme